MSFNFTHSGVYMLMLLSQLVKKEKNEYHMLFSRRVVSDSS